MESILISCILALLHVSHSSNPATLCFKRCNMRTWQIIIANSSEILLLVNTVLCLIFFRRQSMSLKYFTILLLLSLIIQAAAHFLWMQKSPGNTKVNNLYLLHAYTLGEFILITLFYHPIFKERALWRNTVLGFLCIVSTLIVANSIFLQPITVFNSNAKTLTQSIFIAYATAFFLQETSNKENLYFPSLKTINSAILLYYAGSLFIFMFGNVFFQLDDFHKIFWVANALLYLIFQLLVFYAIWQFRQTKSTYS